MTKRSGKDIGASVRARLLHLSRQRGEDFQLLLTRYANERLLYRLATSQHAEHFVLKGAALFTLWTGQPHRATRDIDLLGFGISDHRHVHGVFTEVLSLSVEDDGLHFDLGSLVAAPIREEQEYGGVRVGVTAHVTSARVRLQVDVGFGDAITPGAQAIVFPSLLDFPAPSLRAYPRETVVAEKLEAMVQLGMANSRMKDFFDIAVLAMRFEFEGNVLSHAIRATFERRNTSLPRTLPVALTATFGDDSSKQAQWAGFLRKTGIRDAESLAETVARVARFVERPLLTASAGTPLPLRWPAGGPWR